MPKSIARIIFIVAVVGIGGWLVASWLGLNLARVLSLTTADPGLIPNAATTSREPVTLTLHTSSLRDVGRVREGVPNSISFRVPAAYVRGYTTRSSQSEERSITFAFWSRTLDPVGPDYVEAARICPQPSQPCPNDPRRRRREAGEWVVEVQVFAVVDTPAELWRSTLGQLARARQSTDACLVYEDPELGMTVVTVPESAYPVIEPGRPTERPNFCGRVYGDLGSIDVPRGQPTRYVPPRMFHRFDDSGRLLLRVSCTAFAPDRNCSAGFRFGRWTGRMVLPANRSAEWVKAYSDAVDFLTRHLVSRTDD